MTTPDQCPMTPERGEQWAELERLASKCTGGDPWYSADDLQGRQSFGQFIPQDRAFIAAANPATVLELIAAARLAASPVGGWQPIETAPRDSTEVLVLVGRKIIRLGWYFKPSSRTEGWRDENGNRINPTHWMPLPPPPVSTGGQS